MNLIQRLIGLSFGILFALTLAACGGGGSSSGGSGGGGGGATVATISLSPASVSIAVGATQQFTATAKDSSGNTLSGVTFTWASSSTGVATISPSGLATGVAAGSSNITASASGVTSSAVALTVTAVPPPALAITTTSLPNGTVGATYSATLQASGGTAPYVWSLSSGTLPAGLTLNANTGALAGTPAAAGSSSFTVKVTDSESPAVSVTANLSITVNVASSASELNGQYAFLVSGYDSALAGSVTLDGNGNVTGGTEDIRAPATTLTGSNLSITSGTYTVGSDNRGTLTYKDSAGNSFTFAVALGGISNGVANQGQMIEFDSNPLEMTGSLALQTKADFSASALSGAYAFQSSGWDTTPKPDVTVGSFTAGAGAITNGLFDQNDASSVTAAAAFTGNIGTIDANGRGTATVTTGSGSNTYEIYVVSAGQFLMINDSSNPGVQSGEALQQTGGPFSASSLSGATIFESRSEDGLPAPNVTFGLITFGSGGSLSALIDQDDSGSVNLNQSISGGSWSLASASNGRFLLTPGGHTIVGYLVAPNFAFMTEESAVIPSVSTIEPQTGGPFSASSLNGSFYLGTLPSNSPGAPSPGGGQPAPAFNISSGIVSLNGSGGCSFTLDINSSGVPSSGLTGSDTCSVAANGRITSASGDFVGWMVSPTKFYFLGITQGQPATPNPTLWIIQQ